MFKTIFAVFALILFNFAAAFAQEVPAPIQPNLETILLEAQKQTEFYRETFRNLIADETKTFEEFDKNGNSGERTSVKSNFLVYQSGKDAKVTSELRNVVEVDGKPVPNSQKRSGEFLAELEKASTLEKELQKLQNEGSKYDKTIEVYGLTLEEGTVLYPKIRPYFDFKLLGTENFGGSQVYVVGYQQTKKSPYLILNGKETVSGEPAFNFQLDIPGALKNNDVFLRGKLWIDAQTFQLRREQQELTVSAPDPVVMLSTNFEYQTSDYGILVPKSISVIFYELKKQKSDSRFVPVKDSSVNLEYSKFRQTNVEVKILDDVE
jgi:hypothetical protein